MDVCELVRTPGRQPGDSRAGIFLPEKAIRTDQILGSLSVKLAAALCLTLILLAGRASGAPQARNEAQQQHSNPLNFDSTVREGYERFYILDYEGAISRFE